MDELNSLVGLKDVKSEIQSLTNLIKIRQLREKMNMPVMDMSYHMVFTGSPGTGKTTVARLVGKIYKELGILSDGKMIETDRSGLVAGYVGQTAIKVHEIVGQAIGGVLFIDEAYSLVNPDVPNDFGGEAVDTLVKLMEDNRDNLVIIAAGYTDEMRRFLKSNTGLISRFNKFINFPDYNRSELIEIMEVIAAEAGLTIEEGAKKRVLERMGAMKPEEWEDFGNARGIRNMFEKIVTNQANRLVLLNSPTKEQIMTIVAEDV
ncbi:MAG TPA: AAA family ATPase [Lachnospiraceae bacterium]|nr:AAA family ATPase [Lachnospiraceae bacterium]